MGRGDLVETFGDALDDGPGAPGRATLYTGARGVGKTVMLNEAEDQARQRGWLVISETATPGLLERLENEPFHVCFTSTFHRPLHDGSPA